MGGDRKAARGVPDGFRQVFEGSRDLIAVIDRDAGLLDANAAWLGYHGLTREGAIGRCLPDIVGRQYYERGLRSVLACAFAGETLRFCTTWPFPGLNGSRRLEVTCFPVEGPRGGVSSLVAALRDITDAVERDRERGLTVHLLRLISQFSSLPDLMRDITALLQSYSGCEAVGVLLKEGDGYPYYETRGFPPRFVEVERHPCVRDREGGTVLECMCGTVLAGRTDPTLPICTSSGSFWINSASDPPAFATGEQRQAHIRGRCREEGYESVALIPLRAGRKTLGLLQLNDRRQGMFTPEKIVLFEQLADSITVGLARRRAEEALRRSETNFRTERKRAETEAAARNRELAAALAISALALATGNLEAQLDIICEEVGTATGFPAVLVETYDRGSRTALVRAASGVEGLDLPLLLPLERCLSGLVAQTGRVEVETDPAVLVARCPPPLRRLGVGTLISTPLSVEGEVIGSLCLAGPSAVPADTGLLRLAGSLANTVAALLRRKEAEHRLQETSSRLEAMIASSPLGIATTDLLGTITSWNPTAERLLGYTAQEALDRSGWIMFPPEDHDRIQDIIRHVLAGGNRTDVPARQQHKNGAAVPVSLSMAPLFGKGGEVVGTITVSADISARVRLEAQLMQAQKMESIGRLAGGVAHDFNNILTAIAGYTAFAREEVKDNPAAREYLEEVLRSIESATRLTRQLLAFSRKQAMVLASIDLNRLIGDIGGMLHRLIGEDIAIEQSLDEGLPPIHADPVQIEQVLMNLAANARDAMPGGGCFRIRTLTVTGEGAPPARFVRLIVSDSGHGMGEEVLPHIFEPFFTTKETGKGTGLGLATVYGIVKQHGGEIGAHSRPGEGTEFIIDLPAAADPATGQPGRQLEDAPPGGSETLLLVEDEPSIRRLARILLERLGYSVLVAADGEEALQAAVAAPRPPQLLLSDLVMPRLGGVELARRLRERLPGLRVLYMSGYSAQPDSLTRALALGDAYLSKPFTPRELAGRVREVLDRGD